MATLYIRNVPADLHEDLRRLAEAHDRSLNAEVLDLLGRAAERRRTDNDIARSLAAYFEKYDDQPVDSDAVALIRADRDRGHEPELGY